MAVLAPVPNKPTVSVAVKQHSTKKESHLKPSGCECFVSFVPPCFEGVEGEGIEAVSNPFLGDERATVMQCKFLSVLPANTLTV